MAPRTVLLATILALLAGLVVVPVAGAATAVKASVRVEAAAYRLAPTAAVSVPSSGVLKDTAGNTYTVTMATPLGALGEASRVRHFGFVTSLFGGEPYVASIDGQTSWMYAVNGAGFPNIDVGAFALALLPNDKVLFYQSPTFTTDTFVLDGRVSPGRVLSPGQAVTVGVFGDDLKAPNSAGDAARFGVDPATVVGHAAFPVVSGVIVHIGIRTYFDGAFGDPLDGSITVSDLPPGSYAVWSEKVSTDAVTYVRSPSVPINVGRAPSISRVAARPNPFVPGVSNVRVGFNLSKRADVRLVVKNRLGTVLAVVNSRLPAGRDALVWHGRTSAGRLVGPGVYALRLTATDSWGRTAKPVVTSVTAR